MGISELAPYCPPHLEQHVSWLYASVGRHGPSLHDGADVDAPVATLVALPNNTDAQEVVFLCASTTWQPMQEKVNCCHAISFSSVKYSMTLRGETYINY